MPTTEDIRKRVTAVHRDLISSIWKYFLKEGEWIPVRVLHKQFGGKSKARPLIEELGGSVVFIPEEAGLSRYRLTLLGVLLSDRGEHYEKLLAEYLRFVSQKCYEEPTRTYVSSEEVADALGLEPEQMAAMGHLIGDHRFSSGGTFGKDRWSAKVPTNVEDLPEEILAYIRESFGAEYDPRVPIEPSERSSYYMGKRVTGFYEPFSFISDLRLKAQLESDWREANAVYKVGAWKSCVVLCGGILEGMLLDVLQSNQDKARAAYRKLKEQKRAPKVDRWRLVDMVDVAQHLGILAKGSSYLSHAIREYRNLIHPAKQVAQGIEVTEDAANIAISSIKTFLRELGSRQVAIDIDT
jgi:hypothetical protein